MTRDHPPLSGGLLESVVRLTHGRPERLVMHMEHLASMELSRRDRGRESTLNKRFDEVGPLLTVDYAYEGTVLALGANVGAEWACRNQPLPLEMSKTPARIVGIVARVLQIALRDGPERADGRQHAALVAVDLIDPIAFAHGPALTSAWQIEVLHEHIARVAIGRMIPFVAPATAASARLAEVVAVAVMWRARIASVPQRSPPGRLACRARDAVRTLRVSTDSRRRRNSHSSQLGRCVAVDCCVCRLAARWRIGADVRVVTVRCTLRAVVPSKPEPPTVRESFLPSVRRLALATTISTKESEATCKSLGGGHHRSVQRFSLPELAYNLGNLATTVLPTRIDTWSLTSLHQGLVKTGGRLVKHARHYWLLLAEST